ncbi:MAG: BglG family transcription antiterminator [Anaerovibrio sp.]
MNNRSREIVAKLVSKVEYGQTTTINELAEEFGVSVRTIRYDIEQINGYLQENGIPAVTYGRQGAINAPISIQKVRSSLAKNGFYSVKLSKEERLCFEAIILLAKADFITLDYLAECLFVSRSAVVQDQSALRQLFEENNLYLFSYANKGLLLKGEERYKRKFLFRAIRFYPSVFREETIYRHLLAVISGQDSKYLEDRLLIEKILSETEKSFGLSFTDEAFDQLRIYLELALFRLREKCYVKTEDISKNDKYDMAQRIMQQYGKFVAGDLPEAEILYLGKLLHNVRYIKMTAYNAEIVKMQVVTMSFIENVSKEIDIALQEDYLFYDNLINHLESTFSAGGEYLNTNQAVEDIVERYPTVAAAAQKHIHVLEEYLGKVVSKGEFAYIVVHICAAIERLKSKPVSYSVVLVCNGGIGTARLLQARLEKYFRLDVLDVISAHSIPNFDLSRADAVISTISLSKYGIKYIQINPMLTDEDCVQVGELLSEISPSPSHQESAKDVDNPEVVLKKIHTVLGERISSNDMIEKIRQLTEGYFKRPQYMVLTDLLPEKAIRFDVVCQDWRDSIRESAAYLLENGYIVEQYVDKMIKNVEENGPYIVFAPGFALAHESIDSGALKLGMSLIRLKTPVPYGKEGFDPVEWICCLSTKDKESHLKGMFQMMNLLYDKEYRSRLQSCQNPSDVHALMEVFLLERKEIE